jgi:2TM domain
MSSEPTGLEMRLWKLAKKRARFKKHLIIYLIVIGFLWAIWLLTGPNGGVPWPVWPALAWGLFIAFHYFNTYHGSSEEIVQEEYEKLLKEKEERM